MGNIFTKRYFSCCDKSAQYKCTLRDLEYNGISQNLFENQDLRFQSLFETVVSKNADNANQMVIEFNNMMNMGKELEALTGYKGWSKQLGEYSCTCCENCALMIEEKLNSTEGIRKRWEYDFEYDEKGYYTVDLP